MGPALFGAPLCHNRCSNRGWITPPTNQNNYEIQKSPKPKFQSKYRVLGPGTYLDGSGSKKSAKARLGIQLWWNMVQEAALDIFCQLLLTQPVSEPASHPTHQPTSQAAKKSFNFFSRYLNKNRAQGIHGLPSKLGGSGGAEPP